VEVCVDDLHLPKWGVSPEVGRWVDQRWKAYHQCYS
jgi:hypothetical protein